MLHETLSAKLATQSQVPLNCMLDRYDQIIHDAALRIVNKHRVLLIWIVKLKIISSWKSPVLTQFCADVLINYVITAQHKLVAVHLISRRPWSWPKHVPDMQKRYQMMVEINACSQFHYVMRINKKAELSENLSMPQNNIMQLESVQLLKYCNSKAAWHRASGGKFS